MKTKWVDKNSQGQIEAIVSLTDQEIIFLKEVVKMYDDRRLGDIDDPKIDALKKGLAEQLHEAFKQVRLS